MKPLRKNKYWIVLNKWGSPIERSLYHSKQGAIKAFLMIEDFVLPSVWKEYEKKGCRLIQVSLVEYENKNTKRTAQAD